MFRLANSFSIGLILQYNRHHGQFRSAMYLGEAMAVAAVSQLLQRIG
jgi:hypothetical protein